MFLSNIYFIYIILFINICGGKNLDSHNALFTLKHY